MVIEDELVINVAEPSRSTLAHQTTCISLVCLWKLFYWLVIAGLLVDIIVLVRIFVLC